MYIFLSGYALSLLNTFCVHYTSITGNKPFYLFKYVLTCISLLNGFGEISLCYIIIPLRVLYIVCLLQRHCNYSLTCLPDDTFLDWSKLVAFVDDKVNATQNLKFVLGRVDNIVGKGENGGYQHFLFFPQCFQKHSSTGLLKVGIVLQRV